MVASTGFIGRLLTLGPWSRLTIVQLKGVARSTLWAGSRFWRAWRALAFSRSFMRACAGSAGVVRAAPRKGGSGNRGRGEAPGATGLVGAVNGGARKFSTAVCGIFATISSFFVEATCAAGYPVSLSHGDNMPGGPHDRFDINSDSAADLCRGWRSRAPKIDINQIASR
jgi:hypothetical protein